MSHKILPDPVFEYSIATPTGPDTLSIGVGAAVISGWPGGLNWVKRAASTTVLAQICGSAYVTTVPTVIQFGVRLGGFGHNYWPPGVMYFNGTGDHRYWSASWTITGLAKATYSVEGIWGWVSGSNAFMDNNDLCSVVLQEVA